MVSAFLQHPGCVSKAKILRQRELGRDCIILCFSFKNHIISILSYSIGQNSHKPHSIQAEGNQTYLFMGEGCYYIVRRSCGMSYVHGYGCSCVFMCVCPCTCRQTYTHVETFRRCNLPHLASF